MESIANQDKVNHSYDIFIENTTTAALFAFSERILPVHVQFLYMQIICIFVCDPNLRVPN